MQQHKDDSARGTAALVLKAALGGHMAGKLLDPLWTDYSEHHRTAGNRIFHILGTPLITIGVLGLLLAVPRLHIAHLVLDWALVAIAVFASVQTWLDAKLGIATLLVNVLLYVVARLTGWQVALALFVLGWILQFVGHGIYEKRAPALSKNLAHLLVGPMWVLNHLLRLRSE
jgi:uncharacterized membrane protein YGL010W